MNSKYRSAKDSGATRFFVLLDATMTVEIDFFFEEGMETLTSEPIGLINDTCVTSPWEYAVKPIETLPSAWISSIIAS